MVWQDERRLSDDPAWGLEVQATLKRVKTPLCFEVRLLSKRIERWIENLPGACVNGRGFLDILPPPDRDENRAACTRRNLSQFTRCPLNLGITSGRGDQEEIRHCRNETPRFLKFLLKLGGSNIICRQLALDANQLGTVLIPISPNIHAVLRLAGTPVHLSIWIRQDQRE